MEDYIRHIYINILLNTNKHVIVAMIVIFRYDRYDRCVIGSTRNSTQLYSGTCKKIPIKFIYIYTHIYIYIWFKFTDIYIYDIYIYIYDMIYIYIYIYIM